jgi:hypothetical protein
LTDDGDIYVRGKLVDNDLELVSKLREAMGLEPLKGSVFDRVYSGTWTEIEEVPSFSDSISLVDQYVKKVAADIRAEQDKRIADYLERLPSDYQYFDLEKHGTDDWRITDLPAKYKVPCHYATLTFERGSASGANCSICNKFNEYQSAPFTCYECTSK